MSAGLAILFLTGALGVGTDAPQARPPRTAYCGLHCVYGAVRMTQPDASFTTILGPEFVTGQYGSSATDLVKAFGEFGVGADYVSSISFEQLKVRGEPVILHVRTVGGKSYSHWVLFLGADEDGVWIFDPPFKKTKIAVSDLLAIWDGRAVVPEIRRGHSASVFRHLIAGAPLSSGVLALMALAVCGFAVLPKDKPLFSIAVVCGLSTAFAHCLLSTGFTYDNCGIASIKASYFHTDIPTIDFTEAKTLIESDDVLFVDARMIDSYQRFHLPTAISIPVDSTHTQLAHSVRDLSPSSRVIVYCQSEGCRWADSIASQMAVRGFKNVAIYRGGIRDWMTQHEHN